MSDSNERDVATSTPSTWQDTRARSRTRLTEGETRTDVCIVGAGIAGLSTAYALLRDGRRVVVLDDGPIGGGETVHTSAHLASYLDDRFVHLEKLFGEEGAALAYQSHAAAIDFIEEVCARERIDCGFRRVDGYLFTGKDGDLAGLDAELEATRRAGLTGAERVKKAPLPAFETGPAIRVPGQAQLHPMAYLAGLASAIEHAGGVIATPHHVTKIEEDGKTIRVEDDAGNVVIADACVVATNAPITNLVGLPLKQAAYRTYMIAVTVPDDSVPIALYWDTKDPYHYVRVVEGPDGSPDTVLVGGEDHRTGQENDADARWEKLEAWAREHLGTVLEVKARWSGQVLEPYDSLAYIGPAHTGSGNLYVITGDSGHGLTHGTLGAMIVSDTLATRKNPWARLYDPRRLTARGAGDLVSEMASSVAPYTDWLRAGDVSSAEDLAAGQGGVVRRGLKLVATFVDDHGETHECSAVCPHLGGVVRWNAAEKSWDCPCHGSRFDARGKVLNGPANTDLAAIDHDDEEEAVETVAPVVMTLG